MSMLSVYTAVLVIFIVSVNVERAYTAVPTNVASIKSIKQQLSSDCHNFQDLPKQACNHIINPIKNRVSRYCRDAIYYLCGSELPWPLRLLLPINKCKNELEYYVCAQADWATKYASNECIEELDKVVVGQGCDADGNKVSLCDGLPTTVDGLCTTVVDYLCDELPFLLDPFIPYCQKFLAESVCERKMSL